MTLESVHRYAHSLPEVTEDQPFGPGVLVFRVRTKMFALLGLDAVPPYVNLKCDPERAQQLRAEFDGVKPGYHMNKTHWNSVYYQDDVPADLVRELIRHSWELIVSRMKAIDRDALMAQLDT